MRITSKTIVWSWIGLGLIFSLIIFSAFSRLKPDSLVELLEHRISNIIPNSSLEVGNVKYGVALDFKLTLENINLYKNNSSFIVAKSVEMKIPWWLILLNRGDIHLAVEDVQVLISEGEVKDLTVKTETDTRSTRPSLIEINVPEYLLNAKYTFKGKNLQIKSAQEDRNYLHIARLNIRDFKFDKNSAFEVNIPVSINLNNQKYQSELWLFGDVTPGDSVWNMNYRGEFKSIELGESLKFDDIVLDGAAAFTPAKYQMNSSLDIVIEKSKVGEGSFVTDSRTSNLNFSFNKLPLNYLSILGPDISLGQKLLGTGTANLNVKRNLETGTLFDVSFNLEHQEDYTFSKDFVKKGQWNVKVNNSKNTVSFVSTDGGVNITHITTSESEQIRWDIKNEELLKLLPNIPHFNSLNNLSERSQVIDFTFNNVVNKDLLYNGRMRLVNSSQEQSYLFNINAENVLFDLKYKAGKEFSKIESKFKKAPGMLISHLFTPFIIQPEGDYDGYIKGEFADDWELGKWDINFKVNSGLSAGKLDLWEMHLLKLFSLETTFENSSYDIKIHKGKIDFKNLHWNADEKVELKGVLSDNPQQGSFVILDYPLNKSWKEVRKEVNSTFWRNTKND